MSATAPFDLTGRRAFITAANTGIGRALAIGCARAGADIVAHHHADATGAGSLADEIAGMGRQVAVLELNFSDGDAVASAAAELAAFAPPIDVLILNAAVEERRPWDQLDAAAIEHHLAVNFTASILFMRALVPSMRARRWGRTIAIGSILASRPRSEALVYASLKSAQLTAMRSIARDVAGDGVTVNVISPGAILTERSRQALSNAGTRRHVENKIPVGRIGAPEDCVAPVLMLCSEAGGYITGADIPVDGGWHIGDAMGSG